MISACITEIIEFYMSKSIFYVLHYAIQEYISWTAYRLWIYTYKNSLKEWQFLSDQALSLGTCARCTVSVAM